MLWPGTRAFLSVLILAGSPLLLSAQQPGMTLVPQTGHAVSPPLRDVVPEIPNPSAQVIPRHRAIAGPGSTVPAPIAPMTDAVLQSMVVAATSANTAIGLNFDGMNYDFAMPPDTNLSVGATQVVEIINSQFAVFSKLTGRDIYGPAAIHTVFGALGDTCGTSDGYDPTVLYDKMAGRWLISDANNPLLCVAVSQTSDATGAYNLYSFNFGGEAPDYQKFGIWPDGYYLSVNSQPGEPVGVCAFPRSDMIAGRAVTQGICFPRPPNDGFALPSDLDGSTSPSSGEPNFYLDFKLMEDSSGFSFVLDLFRFHADFTTPSNSTFTGPFSVDGVAPIFFCGSGGGGYLPQPGTSQQLSADCGLLMYRLAYRNFGSHESLVINHSSQVSSQTSSVSPTTATQTGIRWYEIRDPNGIPTVYQQGTYAPDTTTYRWNGSAAQDRDGNIAVGYSVSDGTSVYPGVRYAGRLATDPLNTLEAEANIVNGSASQTNSDRWGDYSSMSVDPVDDCTFWYASEYIPLTPGWSTRIASFKFNSCGAALPPPAPGGVSAVAGKGQVTLTWNASSSANSYNVYRSATSGGPYSPIANNVATTSYTDTGPTGGTTYYYVVTAVNSFGESGYSNEASAMPPPVPDFSMTLAAPSQTAAAGTTAAYTLNFTPRNGFNQPVTLTCSGLPAGATCSSNPVTPTNSGTVTVTIASTVVVQTYPFTITGTAGTTIHSAQATLVVTSPTAADFSVQLAAPSQTSLQGETANYTVAIGSTGGFNNSVSVTCAGMPEGATCASKPASVTPPGSAIVTVLVSGALAPGSYSFAITGTNGSANHSQAATLVVGTITATVAPGNSATVAVGSSANFMVSLSSTNGASGLVGFGCPGIAAALNCTFNPSQVTVPASGPVTTTLTVAVAAKPSSSSVHKGPPDLWPTSASRMVLAALFFLIIPILRAYRRMDVSPAVLSRGLVALALLLLLAIGLVSCGGSTSSSGGASGTSGGSGGTSGGTSGGSSNPVTTQFTMQAQSGGATVNLATVSITVP
jgi:hypothetical protein